MVERSERIRMEEGVRELVILQDAELGEYHNFIDGLVARQQQLELHVWGAGETIQRMQRAIYEMYHELRKYDKTIPPWGGEYKPMDPEDEDKWISDDPEI